MRRLGERTALLMMVMTAGHASAVDLEFGVDALPVLIDAADQVVESSRIELFQEDRAGVVVYAGTIANVIRGEAEVGSRILLAVPRSLALTPDDRRGTKIAFLTGPVTTETANSLLDSDAGPLFWLVGGRHGLIERTRVRLTAIRDYARFGRDERKYPWVRDRLNDRDELLQRSALIELAKPQYASDDDKYTLLAAAAVSESRGETVKDLALLLLELAESPRALPALRAVAVAPATAAGRRAIAVRAIGRLPGGEAELRELVASSSPAVMDLAAAELELLRGERSSLPTPQSTSAGLSSTDADVRARAIFDLRRVEVTPDLLATMIRLLDASSSTGLGERMLLIDRLAAMNGLESADVLSAVSRDQAQTDAVRNAAILGLAQMDAEAAGRALRELTTSLEEGALRELAEALVTD